MATHHAPPKTKKRPHATAPAAATALPPKPRPRHPHISRQSALPLLSGRSTRTSAVTYTRLGPTWHTSSGNTPQPPPWRLHAPRWRPPLRTSTPLRWREMSDLLAAYSTSSAHIWSRPGPLLPLPTTTHIRLRPGPFLLLPSKYVPSFCTCAVKLLMAPRRRPHPPPRCWLFPSPLM